MFTAPNPNLKRKFGWTLLLLSGVPWMLMFAIPWLTIPHPIVVTGVLYGLSQVLWFVGLWCVGKEVLNHVHGLVNTLLSRLPYLQSIKRKRTTTRRYHVQRSSNATVQSSTRVSPAQEQHLNVDNTTNNPSKIED